MANIVITSTRHHFNVTFNDYASVLDQVKGLYPKTKVTFYLLSDRVIAIVEGEKEWPVVYTATSGCFIIDSVNGATPSSNSNLYDLLCSAISESETPKASANVSCGATTTALVSANQKRKGLILTNTGSNAIYLGLNESAVVSKGIYLASGGSWVMDEFNYTNVAINGITTTGSSNVSIQEFE
jgi:hypothetical protein